MELDSNLGLTKKPTLFLLSHVESGTSSSVYLPSFGHCTVKRQCLVVQMAIVLKSSDGKGNGKTSAIVTDQQGHPGLLYSRLSLGIQGLKLDGSQGHCDSRYYYTNVQVTLTASSVCQEYAVFFYMNSHLILPTTT